jgi:hypothetical protein
MSSFPANEYFEIHWAAVPRWAARSSSDVIDVVGSPGGEVTLIMVDVQGSGATGHALAHATAARLAEPVRDGISLELAAKLASQWLCSQRNGSVLASILLARAAQVDQPVTIAIFGTHVIGQKNGESYEVQVRDAPMAGQMSDPAPSILRCDLPAGGALLLPNDGCAGTVAALQALVDTALAGSLPSDSADALLNAALARDQGRPRTDMAVATIYRGQGDGPELRMAGSRTVPGRLGRIVP